MPFMRGMFDVADRSGKRIEYMFLIEMAGNFGAAIGALLLAGLLLVVEDVIALQTFFIITAIVTLLIGLAKFPLYKR